MVYNLRENSPFEYGDIRNQNDISRVIKFYKPDVIFHLAGQVCDDYFNFKLENGFRSQCSWYLQLTRSCPSLRKRYNLVYSSTNKVYGDLEQFNYLETDTRYECIDKPSDFDENTQLDFHSPYGCSKGTADQIYC